MWELQIQALRLWYDAGDRLRAARQRVADDRDRGEVTATTALIFILVVAAIAAAGIIATKIRSNAENVPEPSP